MKTEAFIFITVMPGRKETAIDKGQWDLAPEFSFLNYCSRYGVVSHWYTLVVNHLHNNVVKNECGNRKL